MEAASSATTTDTTPFQPSLRLKTLRSTTASFASALTSLDASERKYWEEKFGLHRSLGASAVVLVAGTASAVHHIACGSGDDHDRKTLVVACGPRVQLYGTSPQSALNAQLRRISQRQRQEEEEGGEPSSLFPTKAKTNPEIAAADRQIPTGGQLALCSAFRSDGQLLAVGTEAGVRIAQVATRATLATFPAPFPVRALAWFRSGKDVLAACEDALRVYRLADAATGGGRPLRTCRGHGDVVRCGALWQSPSEALAFTGSYDHTVRVWDMTSLDDPTSSPDNDGCISVLPHGAPVEAIIVLDRSDGDDSASVAPSRRRPWLVSAGGTHLKVWDLQTGACLRECTTRHNKTVTTLLALPRVVQRPDGTTEVRTRILTGGLDGCVGVHAWNPVTGALVVDVYGVRLGDEAITALGGTQDRLAIGTLSGKVQVRQRAAGVPQTRRPEPRAGTYAFFTRGMNANAVAGDYVVGADSASKKQKLNEYDKALKAFRYGDALDEALSTKFPQVVIAVLEELGRRRGLTIALSNRDEESLEPVLAFTVRYLARPRFTALLVGVANKLVDIYGDVSGQSETIDELFVKLKQQVSAEARVQRKLLRIVGQIEAIAASAAMELEDESLP